METSGQDGSGRPSSCCGSRPTCTLLFSLPVDWLKNYYLLPVNFLEIILAPNGIYGLHGLHAGIIGGKIGS